MTKGKIPNLMTGPLSPPPKKYANTGKKLVEKKFQASDKRPLGTNETQTTESQFKRLMRGFPNPKK